MLVEFVKSKVTGGHYAFKTSDTAKPFTNKMTEALLAKPTFKHGWDLHGAWVKK